jgi:hypothetical protein
MINGGCVGAFCTHLVAAFWSAIWLKRALNNEICIESEDNFAYRRNHWYDGGKNAPAITLKRWAVCANRCSLSAPVNLTTLCGPSRMHFWACNVWGVTSGMIDVPGWEEK